MNLACEECGASFRTEMEIYTTLCGHSFNVGCLTNGPGRDGICSECKKNYKGKELIRTYFSYLPDVPNSELKKDLETMKRASEAVVETFCKKIKKIDDDIELNQSHLDGRLVHARYEMVQDHAATKTDLKKKIQTMKIENSRMKQALGDNRQIIEKTKEAMLTMDKELQCERAKKIDAHDRKMRDLLNEQDVFVAEDRFYKQKILEMRRKFQNANREREYNNGASTSNAVNGIGNSTSNVMPAVASGSSVSNVNAENSDSDSSIIVVSDMSTD